LRSGEAAQSSVAVARRDHIQPIDEAVAPDRLGPAVTFATTEHFNLQTARAATICEANGRASIYLAALSSNLIALAFIGQMSRLGTAFRAFALILLPALAFVGTVTFQRLVQFSIEDIAYAQRIGRLRGFYLALAPELEPYVLAVSGSRAEALLHRESLAPSGWQLALTTAGMVAVVNSVVIGACGGLIVETLFTGSLLVALAVGAVTGVATLIVQRRHHLRVRDAYAPRPWTGPRSSSRQGNGRDGLKEETGVPPERRSRCRPRLA
jgi:hypothetical protein